MISQLATMLCVVPLVFPTSRTAKGTSLYELRERVTECKKALGSAVIDLAFDPHGRSKQRDGSRQWIVEYMQLRLSHARASLAMVEGNLERAAGEWRKVLKYQEDCLKVVEEMYARGRICDDGSGLEQARSNVAEYRAYVAEAERKPDVVVTELHRVVAFQQKYITKLRALMEKDAASMEDVRAEEKRLQDNVHRLETAKKLLKKMQ